MPLLRFCRSTLSRDKIERGVSHNFFKTREARHPNGAVLCSMQLCRENALNADWLILVFLRQSCSVYSCILQLCRAIRLRDKIVVVTLVLYIQQEAQLSPRDPRDALYQLKCCPTVVQITPTDLRVSLRRIFSNRHVLFGYLRSFVHVVCSTIAQRACDAPCHIDVTLK